MGLFDPIGLLSGGGGGVGGGAFSNTDQAQDNSTNANANRDIHLADGAQTITYQSLDREALDAAGAIARDSLSSVKDSVATAADVMLRVIESQQVASQNMFNESVGLLEKASAPDAATAEKQVIAFAVVMIFVAGSWAYAKKKGKS